MSIWNKILIGLILVVTPASFILGARALKTHQYWRELAQKAEASLETAKAEVEVLREGTPGEGGTRGIRQVKLDLHKMLLDRGRLWRNVAPGRVNPQTGAVSAATDQPDPNGITVQTVLHVFEERPVEEKGRYLGEFIVTGKADKQLELQPSYVMSPDEIKRLASSSGPWVLRDVLPVDTHEIFAGLDEGKLRAMFPETTAGDYLKHGKKGQDGTDFARDLRDYRVLLTSFHQHRAVLAELLAAANRDNQYLQAAWDDAKAQEKFRTKEIDDLKTLLAEENRQLAAVQVHLKAVQDKLAELRQGVDQLIQANRQTASQVAKIHAEAIERIDAESRQMAQVSR